MIAFTRAISASMRDCELVHLERVPLDLERVRAQHRAYCRALRDLGCGVVELPALNDLPDSVFVEDTAVVFDELALITRPGAESRRPEIGPIARALADHRELFWITEPATVDGGDLLVVGKQVFVGASSRTNGVGLRQVRDLLSPRGYQVLPLEIQSCLHLKSAVSYIGDDTLLVNPAWVDADSLSGFDRIEVDPEEPTAANSLLVAATVVHAAEHPRTRERMESRGFRVVPVELSEIAKAEGAVSCCSLLVG